MQHPLIHDHLALGWYLFGGLVVILLFLDARLQRHRPPLQPGSDLQHSEVRYAACNKGLLHCPGDRGCRCSGCCCSRQPLRDPPPVTPGTAGGIELALPVGRWRLERDLWRVTMTGCRIITARLPKTGLSKRQRTGEPLFIGYYPLQKQGEEVIDILNRIGEQPVWRTYYPGPACNRRLVSRCSSSCWKMAALEAPGVIIVVAAAADIAANQYQAKAFQVLGFITGEHRHPWLLWPPTQAMITSTPAACSANSWQRCRRRWRDWRTGVN